jgi:hypothetical protein
LVEYYFFKWFGPAHGRLSRSSHCLGVIQKIRETSGFLRDKPVRIQTTETKQHLVGGLEPEFYFPYIGKFIILTDEVIFFRGVGIPPTRHVFFGDFL